MTSPQPSLTPAEVRRVSAVLASGHGYDALTSNEGAAVRCAWQERCDQLLGELNLATEFRARGRSWSEALPDGTVVTRS